MACRWFPGLLTQYDPEGVKPSGQVLPVGRSIAPRLWLPPPGLGTQYAPEAP